MVWRLVLLIGDTSGPLETAPAEKARFFSPIRLDAATLKSAKQKACHGRKLL
jgi:hypothetical protein